MQPSVLDGRAQQLLLNNAEVVYVTVKLNIQNNKQKVLFCSLYNIYKIYSSTLFEEIWAIIVVVPGDKE